MSAANDDLSEGFADGEDYDELEDDTTGEEQDDAHRLLQLAVAAAIDGADFAAVVDKVREQGRLVAPAVYGPIPESEDGALAFFLGRTLAQVLPNLPGRPRLVAPPLPGRNEPCYCGSGRKFKSCCAGKPLPSLPVEPELAFYLVMEQSTPEQIEALLGANQVSPRLAVRIADLLAGAEAWDDLVALTLYQLKNARKFDEDAHGDLLDRLTDAWEATDVDPVDDPEIAALEKRLPSRLRAILLRWKAVHGGGADDAAPAFELAQQAAALDPEHPANAAVEQLIHYQQGDLEQGSARARYWLPRVRKLEPPASEQLLSALAMASESPLGFAQSIAAPQAPAGAFAQVAAFVDGLASRPVPTYRLELQPGDEHPLGRLEAPAGVAKLEKIWAKKVEPFDLGLGLDRAEQEVDPWAEAGDWLPLLGDTSAGDSVVLLADLTALVLAAEPSRALLESWLEALGERAHAILAPLADLDHCRLPAEEPRHFAAARITLLRALRRLEAEPGDHEALAAVERCLRWDVEDPLELAPTLLGLYIEMGRDEDALALIQEYGDEFEPEYTWNHVLALYRTGRLEEAEGALSIALSETPEVSDLLLADNLEEALAETEAGPDGIAYAEERSDAWRRSEGALAWLANALEAHLEDDAAEP